MLNSKNVDPCIPCLRRFGTDKKAIWPGNQITNLNSLNECLFNTTAQFVDGGQDAVVQSDIGKKAQKCYQSQIIMNGKSPLQYRLEPPVINLIPKCFRDVYNNLKGPDSKEKVQKALELSQKMCESSPNKFECQNACQLAAESVIIPDSKLNSKLDSIKDSIKDSKLNSKLNSLESKNKVLYSFQIILAILIGVAVILIIYEIFRKRN